MAQLTMSMTESHIPESKIQVINSVVVMRETQQICFFQNLSFLVRDSHSFDSGVICTVHRHFLLEKIFELLNKQIKTN